MVITFSITFETSSKSETRQYFFGSVFEPFLYNGLSLAILQSKENFKRFSERLHSFDISKSKTTVIFHPQKILATNLKGTLMQI